MEMPEPGAVLLNKYRLDEVLGEGGFGVVFLGTTLQSGRRVAIKVLKPGSEGYDVKRAARFIRELRTIAKLQNPHTLTMYDYGKTDEGLLLMITEYVEGEDLSELIKRRGTLSEFETIHILLQVLESLREAHEIGVLHRDIKPPNIRVFEYAGDPLRVKVLDFGLAKSLGTGEIKLTEAGKVVGTPRFMSPEQLRGKKLNPQTDIYSLGLVAIELLLGRRESVSRSTNGRPELAIGDPVRRESRLLVNRMLARRQSKRYGSATDVISDLQPMLRRLKRVAKAPPALVPRQSSQSSEPPTDDTTREQTAETRKTGVETTQEDVVGVTDKIREAEDSPVEHATAEGPRQVTPRRGPPHDRRPGISMAVERLPRWGWAVAVLVAVALMASALRFYQSYSEEEDVVAVPRRAQPTLRTHTGTPGCGQLTPHRGYGIMSHQGESVPVIIPHGYDPFGALPVMLMFTGQDRGAWLFRRDYLTRFADLEDVLIVLVTEGVPPAPVLASLTNTLCVDMRHVFAVGLASGARELLRARCSLPLRAMAMVQSKYNPEPPCSDPPPTLVMSVVERTSPRVDYDTSAWMAEHGCTSPRTQTRRSRTETTYTCDRAEFREVTYIWEPNGDELQLHNTLWQWFYAHLDR